MYFRLSLVPPLFLAKPSDSQKYICVHRLGYICCNAIFSLVKMCWQPAIWPSTTKYLLLTSAAFFWRPLQLQPLLPITIASLPTTQKHFDWAVFCLEEAGNSAQLSLTAILLKGEFYQCYKLCYNNYYGTLYLT